MKEQLEKYLAESDYDLVQRSVIANAIASSDFFFTYCVDIPFVYFEDDLSIIWQSILAMYSEFECEVSGLALVQHLRKDGRIKKPSILISKITDNTCFSHTEKTYNVGKLIDINIRRNTYNVGVDCINKAVLDTAYIEAVINEAHDKLDSNGLNVENVSLDFLPAFADDLINSVEVLYKTHIKPVDQILNGGFGKQDLVIVGARPGMGKTEVALHVAYESAKAGISVLIVSLEMSKRQLAKRLITKIINSELGYFFDNKRLKDKQFSNEDIEHIKHATALLQKLPIFILDSADTDITCENLKIKIQKIQRKHKIELVFLDHLHKVQHENNKIFGEEAVGKLAVTCKNIAKQLNIVFIALCQLNRSVETRDDKRPNNSDLRQSGQLEQEADTIIFLYRQDYYMKKNNDMHVPDNEIEYIFGKQRTGSVQTAYGRIFLNTNTIAEII